MRAKKRSLSGPVTIAAMFALGLAVMGGMFIAARYYKGSGQFEFPRHAVRVVSIDLRAVDSPRDSLMAIRSIQPAVVLMQNMRESDVESTGSLLGMKHVRGESYSLGADRSVDVIYSTFELSELKRIDDGSTNLGVRVLATSQRSQFLLASIHLPPELSDDRSQQSMLLSRVWRQLEGPPGMVGIAGCTLSNAEIQPIAPNNAAQFGAESRMIIDAKSERRGASAITDVSVPGGTVVELSATAAHR